jgi:phosphoglycolate phosphatase
MDAHVKAVVFDLDGTLVDSADVCARLFNGMLADKNCQRRVTAARIQATLSIGGIPMIRTVLEDACTDANADLAEFRRRYAEMRTPDESLYPGIRSLLEKLRQSGYRLGLCTKKPERLAHKVLRELQLDTMFQAVSCGDSTEHPKPDARHLTVVLTALGCSASNAWMVGDSSVDASLARNANVRFAYATYGYGAEEVDEADCDLVFDHAGELAEQLIAIDQRHFAGLCPVSQASSSRTVLTP